MRVRRAVANFNRRVANPSSSRQSNGSVDHTVASRPRDTRTSRTQIRQALSNAAAGFPIRDGFVVLIGYELGLVEECIAGREAVLHKRGKSIALANPRLPE